MHAHGDHDFNMNVYKLPYNARAHVCNATDDTKEFRCWTRNDSAHVSTLTRLGCCVWLLPSPQQPHPKCIKYTVQHNRPYNTVVSRANRLTTKILCRSCCPIWAEQASLWLSSNHTHTRWHCVSNGAYLELQTHIYALTYTYKLHDSHPAVLPYIYIP